MLGNLLVRRAKAATSRREKIFHKNRTSVVREMANRLRRSAMHLPDSPLHLLASYSCSVCRLADAAKNAERAATTTSQLRTATLSRALCPLLRRQDRLHTCDKCRCAPACRSPICVVQSLDSFAAISVDEVDKLIIGAPNKQRSLDPVPAWPIKRFHFILAPVISIW